MEGIGWMGWAEGVPCKNESGSRLVDFCCEEEGGDDVGNMYTYM